MKVTSVHVKLYTAKTSWNIYYILHSITMTLWSYKMQHMSMSHKAKQFIG